MAKKVKIPRKAVTVAKDAATGDVIADAAPGFKAGGKRKARRLSADPAAAGLRRPKRDGKAKTKAARGDLRSAPKALVRVLADVLRRPETGAPAKPSARKAGVQRPARLGRLERLEAAIEEVRLGGRLSPRTRKLQLSGVPKMAQKVIEEAGEVAVEALLGNGAGLVNESVDLLYNLLVLLSGSGVTVDMLWAEMDRREIALGMAEKLPKAPDPES